MEMISDEILNGVLPFIGEYHFRFIAAVNHKWYHTYTLLYPKKETYLLNGNLKTSLRCDDVPSDVQVGFDEIHPETFIDVIKCTQIALLHEIVAQYANIKLLQYLQEIYQHVFGFYGMPRSEEFHDLKYADWSYAQHSLCSIVALHGHLNVIRIAHCQYGYKWDATTCANAALNGHSHIVQFLYKHGCPWDSQTRVNADIGSQNKKLSKWLEARGCRVPKKRQRHDNGRHEEYHNYMSLVSDGYY